MRRIVGWLSMLGLVLVVLCGAGCGQTETDGVDGAGIENVPNATDEAKLRAAVKMGRVDEVKDFLARAPQIVNNKDNMGNTLLHLAAVNGRVDVAQVLLDAGADVNARDNDGYTPVKVAMDEAQTDMAKFLESQGGTE